MSCSAAARKCFYDKFSDLHVSGHAYQEELKMMMALVKPKCFIPLHGEYRHLRIHAKIAQQMGRHSQKHCRC